MLLGWPTHGGYPLGITELPQEAIHKLQRNPDWESGWVSHHRIEASDNAQKAVPMP
jgi:hypothetical protein